MDITLKKKLIIALFVGLVLSLTGCDGTLISNQIIVAQDVCANHKGLNKATSVRESRVVAYCNDGVIVNAPVDIK